MNLDLSQLDNSAVAWIGVGLVALLAAIMLGRLLRRSTAPRDDVGEQRKIDLQSLPANGPPAHGPHLELYHLPMRLAALALAPVGRGGRFPVREEMPAVLDSVVPGLVGVVASHQPKLLQWPPQPSSQGFANAFFASVSLPGDQGQGTPWSAVAGRVQTPSGPLMVGLLLRAATPNAMGTLVIDQPAKWLDALRIKV